MTRDRPTGDVWWADTGTPIPEWTAAETCRHLATVDGQFNAGRYAALMGIGLTDVFESEAERVANATREQQDRGES